jgi:uncharacterized membrane protein YidH (DUF202 family)
MNWKKIVGVLLILFGTTQFLKLINEYRYNNSLPVSLCLGLVFIALVITGVFLVRLGKTNN